MIDKLELGIICNKDGKIINHRSIIKVLINPFLRIIGIQIATKYDMDKNILLWLKIMKCRIVKKISFGYDNNEFYIRKKERMFI